MILRDPALIEITVTPRPNPKANAFKTGTPADCPRVPEDEQAITKRTHAWFDSFHPQNYFHGWLVDQVVVNSFRIDRNVRIDRRLRDRVVMRAERFWDDDRRLEAELLGEQLAKKPAATLNKLRQTPHGCDWLIGRWAALARIGDGAVGWDLAQKDLAFGLLGVRLDERSGVPGETIDLDGKLVGIPIGEAELARQQIAGLRARKQEVADLDALDKAMALNDYADEPTPEIRRLRRTNAELHRQLKWCVARIDSKSPYPSTKTNVFPYFEAKSDAEQPTPPVNAYLRPETEPVVSELDPEVEDAESQAEDKTWPYIINARREAKDRKADAVLAAKQRKRERLRA